MINSLDISAFENGKKFISLGKIRPEIVSFLIEKEPSLSGQLNSETEILFWKDRLRHTELHKDDFFSDNEFYNCLERIPFIISNPDYISVHKKDNSISFIKDFSAHVSVAIRISSSGSLSYRTMYPITDAQLNNYISKGSSWKWNEPQNT
jgi:hypothetical protein|uniref:Nuclease n=1 Tax=Siphoviridae sp. ctoyo6 TaxID=2825674 RepID=A0A8S5U396_9CAUD|nr:MAG TPA: nuclease [Siphoviridae sp. ctoyo6]